MGENDKLARVTTDLVRELMPKQEFTAYSLAMELRQMLNAIKDEGTNIDSGAGFGGADLWVKVQGVEYSIHVEPTAKAKEGTE